MYLLSILKRSSKNNVAILLLEFTPNKLFSIFTKIHFPKIIHPIKTSEKYTNIY